MVRRTQDVAPRATRKARAAARALWLAAMWLGLLVGAAGAAKPSPYAVHYEAGRKLAHNGDRRGAIRAFEKAYAIDHTPEALFNIGVLYKNLAMADGKKEDAQRALDSLAAYQRRFREIHGTDPADQLTVERYDKELRAKFAIAAAPLAPATSGSVAPAPSTSAPSPTGVASSPASLAPTSSASTTPAAVAATPAAAPAATSVDTKRPALRIALGGALLGVGLIGVVGGGALLGLAGSDGNGQSYPTLADWNSHVGTSQGAGGALLGIGAAALVAGAVVLALPVRKADSAPKAARVIVAPTWGGAMATGSF